MKKFYYLLASMAFVLILIASCEKAGIESDELNALQDEVLLSKSEKADKVDVCHYDVDLGVYMVISISQNGWDNGHSNHEKDVLLIDEDGDGFVTFENECVPYGDCDDTDPDVYPDAEKICENDKDNNCDEIDDCLTYVPDDSFENYLETHNSNNEIVTLGDINSMGNGIEDDNYVYTENINTVTELYVQWKGISNLTGIEEFTSLQTLQCHGNKLTKLDVSNNVYLTDLSCQKNVLEVLDVSKNINLTRLLCNENKLESLDVSNNVALLNLGCYKNPLKKLDVSKNTELTQLGCTDIELTEIDVSNNLKLENLYCYNNLLTTLDIKANKDLTILQCYNNLLTVDATNKILADLVYNGINDGTLKFLNNATGQGITDRGILKAPPRNWVITDIP